MKVLWSKGVTANHSIISQELTGNESNVENAHALEIVDGRLSPKIKNKNCQCEKFLHNVKHRPGDGPPVKSFAARWTGLSALAQQRRNSTPPACRQGHKRSLTPCPLRKKPYLLIQSVFICQDFLANRCAFRFCLSFPCMLTSLFGTKETSLRTFSWKSCPYSHTQSRPLRGKDIALQHPKTIFAQPRRQWS